MTQSLAILNIFLRQFQGVRPTCLLPLWCRVHLHWQTGFCRPTIRACYQYVTNMLLMLLSANANQGSLKPSVKSNQANHALCKQYLAISGHKKKAVETSVACQEHRRIGRKGFLNLSGLDMVSSHDMIGRINELVYRSMNPSKHWKKHINHLLVYQTHLRNQYQHL